MQVTRIGYTRATGQDELPATEVDGATLVRESPLGIHPGIVIEGKRAPHAYLKTPFDILTACLGRGACQKIGAVGLNSPVMGACRAHGLASQLAVPELPWTGP